MFVKIIKMIVSIKKIEREVEKLNKTIFIFRNDLNKRIIKLEKDSHTPVVSKDSYEKLQDEVFILKSFVDNIEKISTEYMKDIAN